MSTGQTPSVPHVGGRTDPPQAGVRAGALPRHGRVPELRHQLHDHLDPRGVSDLVFDRVSARWADRRELGMAPGRAHEHARRALDGGDRVGISHCRRPLLLGVEAREPCLGLVHRLVQPRRPDRGHGVDRLWPRDLLDGASQLLVRLPEHKGVRLPLIRGRAGSGPRDQPVQGQLHGNAEHDFRLLAHDRRGRSRRRPIHRSRHPPLIQLGLHGHGQRDRLGQWHDVGVHLLLRLPHRPADGPVHDHGLRRLGSRRRGDAQCVAGGCGWYVHVGRGIGHLRLHPARGRDQGAACRATARPLHHPLELGRSDGPELGDVPALYLLRRTDVLPDRVGDLRVSDAVRVLARPCGSGTRAVASASAATASRISRSSRSAFWPPHSCCQRSTTSSSATTWAPG